MRESDSANRLSRVEGFRIHCYSLRQFLVYCSFSYYSRGRHNGSTGAEFPVCHSGRVCHSRFYVVGCKLFNHTVNFSIGKELKDGNTAVGLMVMGMFIGIGIALGLVIGLGLN